MNAERESFEPARWSTCSKRSDDSVIEIFSFIIQLYYQMLAFDKWGRAHRFDTHEFSEHFG